MVINDTSVPGKFQQPIKNFTGRIVSNYVEEVDFVPGSNMRIWYNNKAEDYPVHKHACLEIAIPIENSYTYIFEDRSIVLKEKEILIVPPDTLHKISGTREGVRFILLFKIDYLKQFFDYSDFELLIKEPLVVNNFTYPDCYGAVYAKLMNIIDQYFFYTNSVKEIPIFSNLLGAFGLLLVKSYNENLVVPQSHKQREIFIKFKGVLEWLALHSADNISMDEAAEYAGYSKFHFARLFKDYSGMTFYDYRTSLKLKSVVHMLSDTDLQIVDIATACGFNNLASLSRNFQKQYGCSPRQFRNRLRRKKHYN